MDGSKQIVEKLLSGESVSFRPRGNSMNPIIKSGQLCTLDPIYETTVLEKGMAVLCRVKGRQMLHLITATQGERIQISNNHGYVNGWTTRRSVYGVLVNVED